MRARNTTAPMMRRGAERLTPVAVSSQAQRSKANTGQPSPLGTKPAEVASLMMATTASSPTAFVAAPVSSNTSIRDGPMKNSVR